MYQATSISEFGEHVLAYAYATLEALGQGSSAVVMVKECRHPTVVIRARGELHSVKVPAEFEVIRTPAEVQSYVSRMVEALFRVHETP